jgi:hypothetical protein
MKISKSISALAALAIVAILAPMPAAASDRTNFDQSRPVRANAQRARVAQRRAMAERRLERQQALRSQRVEMLKANRERHQNSLRAQRQLHQALRTMKLRLARRHAIRRF